MESAISVAQEFGQRIADSDYLAAHMLLTRAARQSYSPGGFQRSFEEMTAYEPGPIRKVVIDPEFVLEDWPEKRPEDVASVYVGLFGQEYVEAASLILAPEDGDIRIREVEWGRP